jgi:DNA-binding transcriptional MerR regulator
MAQTSEGEATAIPEKSYFRIGEVARITGIKPYVLRYWETEFKTLAPPKSRSKQRLYRRKDIENILAIKDLLYAKRFTIEGARKRLAEMARGQGAAPAGAEAPDRGDAYQLLRGELEGLSKLLAEN